MKKICVITTSRADYGLLKWLMKDISESEEFELQVIAAWGHFLSEQGYTVNQIIKDGFSIDKEIEINVDTSSAEDIAKKLGELTGAIVTAFVDLWPDAVIVLGDRYELVPICSSAYLLHIPIAHISGGDVTRGSIDNGIRNAITMLSTYHFPGTKESADRVSKMTGSHKNVWAVGEPGLDAFNNEKIVSKPELSQKLNLDCDKKWVLFTYHPETTESTEYNLEAVKNSIDALNAIDNILVIMTSANADEGGKQINMLLNSVSIEKSSKFILFQSLGSNMYLNLMRYVNIVVGNSSSGIVEAPFAGCPVVNIGNRQSGRHLCSNVIQCGTKSEDIEKAILQALDMDRLFDDGDYWGDGHTSARIISILKEVL